LIYQRPAVEATLIHVLVAVLAWPNRAELTHLKAIYAKIVVLYGSAHQICGQKKHGLQVHVGNSRH
jgi:hypothetical protein